LPAVTGRAALIRRARLLRPRLAADLVHRPRLIEHLNRGLAHPLTLLATPPGFGKTTLLCDWAARCPIPVAWLCIDERGDDLGSFITHLVAAVQTVVQDIGRETLGLLNLPDLPAPQMIAAVLDNELIELTEEIALVLDDYHLVTNPSVHEFVAALLDLPPPGFHLILATRADPPLPLARLRMRGQLTELRAEHLRFTVEETAAFFEQSASLSLDAATVALIETQAEGWAAGLRLAALSLRDGATPNGVLAAFEGRRLRGLMDFLADEVLAAQPEDVQRFLLHTSVVERIRAPLAAALLDDGASEETAAITLDWITRANLFLSPLEEDPRWHRYHALFRDALRDRLRRDAGHQEVAALHARASAWFDAQELIDEAVYHARAAGDDEAAVRIVERRIHVALDRDDLPALESWLRLLPREALEHRPALILGRSWIAYQRGNWALHGRLLAEAKFTLDANAQSLDAATIASLEGELAASWSMRLLDEGDGAGAAAAAQRALESLPNTHRYVVSLAYHQQAFAELMVGRVAAAVQHVQTFLDAYDRPPDVVFVRMLLALMRIYARSGNLEESRQVAAEVHRLASEQGFLSYLSWATYQLGAIAYELNNLDAARAHFSAVVADPHYAHSTPLRDAAFGLALIQRSRGLDTEAWLTLDRLQEFFRQTGNVEQLALVRALQSHFSPEQGKAMEAILEALGPGQRPAGLVGMLGNTTMIRVHALLKRATVESLAGAESLLEGLLEEARKLHFIGGEIELLALESVLAQTRRQDDDAADTLDRALDLAVPRGFVRTFLDRGPLLAAVLHTLRLRSRHGAYIERLLAAFAAEASVLGRPAVPHPVAPIQVVDALTDREIEILEKLAARLSYKEIAAALVISPFTVKAHASNIYGKLGASGRRDAIARARARGLIADR
jgi:LuxR family maltose regulon positive regulatory protein